MVKVQSKTKVVGNEDLEGMFHQMFDPSKVDPEIAFSKYTSMYNKTKQIFRVLQLFATEVDKVFPEINTSDIVNYVESNNKHIANMIYIKENIVEHWGDFKESELIQEVIIICSCLVGYRQYLADENNLSGKWIKQLPLGSRVFKFSNLDLSVIWQHPNANDLIHKYILQSLHILYKLSNDVYKLYTDPDVDINKFSAEIIKAIDKIKHQPKLSRCNKAFDKIKNSVGLLKDNFGQYYRDMVQSKNASTLMESFLIDIADKETSDPETVRQFRTIINYYKEMQQANNLKNPQLNKIFDVLNDKMKIMTKVHPEAADFTYH